MPHRANQADARRVVAGDEPSQDVYQLLIGLVRDHAIFLLDPEGRVTSWNPGAERLSGYPAAEIVGQHFSRFSTEEDIRAGRPAQALAVAATEGRYADESAQVRRDGSQFYAQVLLTAIQRPNGEVQGFGSVVRDLSETDALRRQTARVSGLTTEVKLALLDTALDCTPHGVVVCDTAGKVLLQNAAAAQISGNDVKVESPADWAGLRVFRPDGQPYPVEERPLARCLRTRQPTPAEETSLERQDGDRAQVISTCSPIVGRDGQLVGAISVFADVTAVRSELERDRILASIRQPATWWWLLRSQPS